MANVEIRNIPTQKTTLIGSEFIPGQDSGGGSNSSFKATSSDLRDYSNEQTGWSMHHDTQYTSGVPLTVTTRVMLTSNDLGALTNISQMPVGDSVGFFNPTTDLIEPTNNGDMLHYRITMQAVPSNSSVVGVLQLQIEDTAPIVIGTKLLTFPNNNERTVLLSTKSFVIANYIANGAGIYLEAETGSIDIYDLRLLVERTHVGR